jgi:outer membrane lipoprotein carrier protein
MRKLMLLGALAGLPGALLAQDADQMMERTARAYRGLSSFNADFWQVIEDPMMGTMRSRGHLIQAGDDKLSMRFSDPAGDAIILDGRHAWVYTPSTTPGQVMKIAVANLPDYLNLGRLLDNPTRRFLAKNAGQERVNSRMTDIITLTPRDPNLPFSEATIWIDREDWLPRRLRFKERTGMVRTLNFAEVRTNQRVSAQSFTFVVPAGVRIVDQM